MRQQLSVVRGCVFCYPKLTAMPICFKFVLLHDERCRYVQNFTCYLFALLITVDFRFVFRQYLFTRGLVPARYAAASPRLRLPDTFFAKKSAARQPVHVLVALRAAEKVGTRRARTPNLRNTAGANMKFHKHSVQHRDNFSLVFIVYR